MQQHAKTSQRCHVTADREKGWDGVVGAVSGSSRPISIRLDAGAPRRFFGRALATLRVTPTEVVTHAAQVYPRVLDELAPSAWHHVERWANNRVEADHSQLKHRLRPVRGLRTDRTAKVIITGLAFLQNLRRGHYELGVDVSPSLRVAVAFDALAQTI